MQAVWLSCTSATVLLLLRRRCHFDMCFLICYASAGAVWCLAQMRFEAPAFMEAAMDRLAACLDATPRDSSERTASGLTAGTANASRAGLTPAPADNMHRPAASAAASSASSIIGEAPSVLQQLYSSPPG